MEEKSAWMKWNQTKKQKRLTLTLKETKKLFFQNFSIKEIAKLRKLKLQTIEYQIIELITLGYIFLGDLVEDEIAHQILETFEEDVPESLKEIKNQLPEEINYFQIKCVLASINNQPDSIYD